MPKLSKHFAKPRAVEVPLGDGEVLTLSVRADKITPAYMNEMQTAKNSTAATVSFLCDVVELWDAEDDRGKIIPLTVEALMQLPVELVRAMTTAIFESISEGNATPSPE